MTYDPILMIVVPCYNEEEVLHETSRQLTNVLTKLINDKLVAPSSSILFVDDGSKDKTWRIIEDLHHTNPYISGLKLVRNFGHQKALLSGLNYAKDHCDCAISIDADLQDDLDVLPEFVEKFAQGNDVVYGVRKNRDTDTFFKRATAQGFYTFMQKMGVNVIYNHADYRLMSKRALNELSQFKEQNLFLRGIVHLMGFPSANVYYDRKERLAGESKYPLKKMISFALDGITSFSIVPIRMISVIGFISFIISSIAGIYTIFTKIFGDTTTGWASLMVSLWFIGGLLLMSVGTIGEYVSKIYQETKERPRYSVEKLLLFENSNTPSETKNSDLVEQDS